MEQPKTKKIGDKLLEKGIITPEQLKIALEIQKSTTRLLGEVLVDLGFINENELASLLSKDMEAMHIPSLEGYSIDHEALRLVPKKTAQELKVAEYIVYNPVRKGLVEVKRAATEGRP